MIIKPKILSLCCGFLAFNKLAMKHDMCRVLGSSLSVFRSVREVVDTVSVSTCAIRGNALRNDINSLELAAVVLAHDGCPFRLLMFFGHGERQG